MRSYDIVLGRSFPAVTYNPSFRHGNVWDCPCPAVSANSNQNSGKKCPPCFVS